MKLIMKFLLFIIIALVIIYFCIKYLFKRISSESVYLCTKLENKEDSDFFVDWKKTMPLVPEVFKDNEGNVINLDKLEIFWDPKNKKWILVKPFNKQVDNTNNFIKGDVVMVKFGGYDGLLGSHRKSLVLYYTELKYKDKENTSENRKKECERLVTLGRVNKDTDIFAVGKVIFEG